MKKFLSLLLCVSVFSCFGMERLGQLASFEFSDFQKILTNNHPCKLFSKGSSHMTMNTNAGDGTNRTVDYFHRDLVQKLFDIASEFKKAAEIQPETPLESCLSCRLKDSSVEELRRSIEPLQANLAAFKEHSATLEGNLAALERNFFIKYPVVVPVMIAIGSVIVWKLCEKAYCSYQKNKALKKQEALTNQSIDKALVFYGVEKVLDQDV